MSLANLFSYADSLFQAQVKNPPGGEWSVVVLASLYYPYYLDDSGEQPRGRLQYSPGQLVHVGTGAYLEPSSFSGDIPCALGEPGEVSFVTASTAVTAPSFLAFRAGDDNYSIDARIPGYPEQRAAVPDELPSVFTTPYSVSVSWEAQYAQSNLVIWGFPYVYPSPIHKLPEASAQPGQLLAG
jgi:hypothetical protein